MFLAKLLERWSQLETSSTVECSKTDQHYFVKYGNQGVLVSLVEKDNDHPVWAHLQGALQMVIIEHEFSVQSTYSPFNECWDVDIYSTYTPTYHTKNKNVVIALLDAYVQTLEELAKPPTKQYLFVTVETQDGENKYAEECILVAEKNDDPRNTVDALLSQWFGQRSGDNLPTFTEEGLWDFPDDYRKIFAEKVKEISEEEYGILRRLVTEKTVEFPHRIVATGVIYKLVEFTEGEKKELLYQGLSNPNQFYNPLAAYCHMMGIHIRENFPNFEIDSWVDAEFTQ